MKFLTKYILPYFITTVGVYLLLNYIFSLNIKNSQLFLISSIIVYIIADIYLTIILNRLNNKLK